MTIMVSPDNRSDVPATRTPTEALLKALRNGSAGITVCYSKCWSCKFGDHFAVPTPHTWMDDEDAAAAGVAYPLSPEDEAKHQCGCMCTKGPAS